MITHTLAFLVDGERVLLGQHQRGIGVGKWNGFGGKVEGGETVEAGMIREVNEECGLAPTKFSAVAELHFKGPGLDVDARVFMVTGWTGELRASDEMKPQWFDQSQIPFDRMWDDDDLWLPHVLHGDRLKAWFNFDAENKVVDYKINKGNFAPSHD